MSVMLYPCMLCVACLTMFVNCLLKQFAMCLGVVAILLLNVMNVFSVCGGALLDRPRAPIYYGQRTLSVYTCERTQTRPTCSAVMD